MLHSAYNPSIIPVLTNCEFGIPVAQHLGKPDWPLSLDQTILFGGFTPAI